jgi:acylphosphatase
MDGAVEVLAEGEPTALQALETFLRQGPRMSNVGGIDVFWETPQGNLSQFEII